jgi:LPS-assembly protein
MPLLAQQPEVLPAPGDVPTVDTITPVPAPKLSFGEISSTTPTMPKAFTVTNLGGKIEYAAAAGTLTYHGAVKMVTDTGTTLTADRAVVDTKTETATLTGMVKVRTETGIELFADEAVADGKLKSITATGNVSIYQGNSLQRGQRVTYFWERKFLDTAGLRGSAGPVLMEAGKFTAATDSKGNQVFIGHDAGITTDDQEDPSYWLRADRTTIYPGDKVTFRNLKVYAGDVPVLWLPYLSQPLHEELGYHFVPGARSNWGAFLLNTYGIMLGGERDPVTGDHEDAWLLSKWHLDFRTSRGVGTGVDLVDTRLEEENPNLSGLRLYYLKDLDSSTQRSGIPRLPINDDRYVAEFKHRVPFDMADDAEWRFDFDLTKLSDQYYLEDFEPQLQRRNPYPDNTIGLYRNDGRSLASIVARVRVNDFYRSDERLPEIAFDQARAPIFDWPILHEGTTSLSWISERTSDPTRSAVIEPLLSLPNGDPRIPGLLAQLPSFERELIRQIRALPPGSDQIPSLTRQLLDPSYARFHTYQEVSLPLNVGGWLNVTPEVGVGYRNYWDVAGPANSMNGAYLEAGAEASVKFSKDLGGYHDRALGLDGLVHVFQPYSRWSVVSADELGAGFPKIDRLTFATRPQTLDLGRFTAIDDIKDWNIVRFGVHNRLLTRRDGQSYEWLYLNTYMDAFLRDPERLDRDSSNLYNDLRWRPLPWMSVDLETQVPVINEGSGFSEVATRFKFQPTDNVEFSIGHRLLNNHPVLIDSNQIDLRLYSRIAENWGLGMIQRWELDDSTLEYEQYSLHRDFGSWVVGVGLNHRDNRVKDEYGVMFTLTLKDFPSASLPLQVDAE